MGSIINNSMMLEAYNIDGIVAKFKKWDYRNNPNQIDDTIEESYLCLEKDNEKLLKHCCIHNEYALDTKNLKYVRLNNITLKDEIKASKEKIGKKLIYKNCETYKQNGFDRIVLRAVNDGVVAWKKLGFNFDNPIDEKVILKQLKLYLIEVKNRNENNKFKSLLDVNKDLFFDEKINFTEWLDLGNNGLHMTLRIKDVK